MREIRLHGSEGGGRRSAFRWSFYHPISLLFAVVGLASALLLLLLDDLAADEPAGPDHFNVDRACKLRAGLYQDLMNDEWQVDGVELGLGRLLLPGRWSVPGYLRPWFPELFVSLCHASRLSHATVKFGK